MITTEKLNWLTSHLRHGDQKLISEKTGVNYSSTVSILNGHFWGEHGSRVVAFAEEFINDRIKREEKERKKYSKL